MSRRSGPASSCAAWPTELGVRDKLAMVVNRANSGVSVADMERTVGMPAMALIRSGGLLFVRAANEGRSVVEQFPKEKVTEDFDALADRLAGHRRQAGRADPDHRAAGPPGHLRPNQGNRPSLTAALSLPGVRPPGARCRDCAAARRASADRPARHRAGSAG